MGQRLAFVALVLLFSLPLLATGIYFFKQGKESGSYEMGWIFTIASWVVIGLGIIACFI